MPEPLFVISLPRSGSTFMVELLSSHPDIVMTCHGNWLPWLRRCYELSQVPPDQSLEDKDGFRAAGMVSRKVAPGLGRSFLNSVPSLVQATFGELGMRGEKYFGDKILSPQDLAFAKNVWPSMRAVHLVRDFRDVLVSSFGADHRKLGFGWSDVGWTERVQWAIDWMGAATPLVDSISYARVKYEELVTQPREVAARLFASLGLSYADSVDQFLAGQAKQRFRSHGTSASPESSIGRWQDEVPGEFQEELVGRLSPLLKAWGYDLW